MFTFANPLGLLALLGIPAVLAIHFLQRKAAELPVSTLFLLERTQREAASGRRWDRLIPSIPLWMQLLAVLLLTWFLAEPRFPKAGSAQRIALVLDSSASMEVFKESALARLLEELPQLQGGASSLELIALPSNPDLPRLYAGASLEELRRALEPWHPRDGLIDPTAALRLARSLVSRDGIVLYLTDTPTETLPFGALTLAVGEAIENVGFTGVSFAEQEGSLVWQALVRHYGSQPAERTWSLHSSLGSTEPRPLSLAPGALVTLQAAFPANAENVRLVLSPDRFPLDDVLPLVAPAPKPLTLFSGASDAFADLSQKLLRALDAAVATNDAASADLSLLSYDPLDPVLPPGNAIVFVEDSTRSGEYLTGGLLAEAHPLMEGINWQSLLVRETIELDRLPADRVLLWQETRPLIFLREQPATPVTAASRKLCFNFDLRLSNAASQPAFIVLLHRFAASLREAKVAPESLNLETGQPVRLAAAPGAPLSMLHTNPEGIPYPAPEVPAGASSFRVPAEPGFLTIRQQGTTLLQASLHFADTREADFSQCGRSETPRADPTASLQRNTLPDPFWRLALLLLLAVLLVSWKFIARPSPSGRSAEA